MHYIHFPRCPTKSSRANRPGATPNPENSILGCIAWRQLKLHILPPYLAYPSLPRPVYYISKAAILHIQGLPRTSILHIQAPQGPLSHISKAPNITYPRPSQGVYITYQKPSRTCILHIEGPSKAPMYKAPNLTNPLALPAKPHKASNPSC